MKKNLDSSKSNFVSQGAAKTGVDPYTGEQKNRVWAFRGNDQDGNPYPKDKQPSSSVTATNATQSTRKSKS